MQPRVGHWSVDAEGIPVLVMKQDINALSLAIEVLPFGSALISGLNALSRLTAGSR